MELTRGDTGLFKFQRVDANGDVITSLSIINTGATSADDNTYSVTLIPLS